MDLVIYAVIVLLWFCMLLNALGYDPFMAIKRWAENQERERIGRNALHKNSYQSREDGYQYPRCDIPRHHTEEDEL